MVHHMLSSQPHRRKDLLHSVKSFGSSLSDSVTPSPQANYTDWTTATWRRNLVPTFVDRGVSRGQRGGSPTAEI
jgi:hypothetical protein